MKNLNAVAKEIKIISKQSKKGGKNHFVRVELINDKSADVWCEKEVVELIQTCKELNVEPIKSFALEKRISEKTGEPYVAVVLKMFNDHEYFYFLPRATNTIVELLAAKMENKE
ncbi:MAG: hypothetical protein LBN07_04885 [Christensenellaceae bacterium]|jgi:hypothetical protein|nr:hypothetical protein [Christensenellaceae bacterium]